MAATCAGALALAVSAPGPTQVAPPGVAPAFASASASAIASARTRPPAAEPLGALPTEKSARPTPDEWKTASLVAVPRRSPASRTCRAYRVREWIKVHCDKSLVGFRQLAGNTDDVLLWVEQKPADNPFAGRNGGQVIFPLHLGDRRIFQAFELSGGEYQGIASDASVVIEARWLDGDAAPRLILR
jgi:hypothetical protein